MNMDISKLIVETFEHEQPSLCAAIKLAVTNGEARPRFLAFIKSVFGPGCENMTSYQLSITVFDYYKKVKT